MGVKVRPATHKAEDLSTIYELSKNVEASTSHKPMGIRSLLQG
jgi:hypothetical protein